MMPNETLTPIDDAIRGTFQQWHAEQEPLAAELNESLEALAAFQSHLDDWQQQLVRERETLAAERQQFEIERAAFEESDSHSAAETAAELAATREKVATLTNALLARTDELRVLDGQRAEAVTELELARAREKELNAKLADHKQLREQEQLQWAEEMRQLRELFERRLDTNDNERRTAMPEEPQAPRPPAEPGSRRGNSPVLGSIVEQFGKLRQQRASERPGPNKPR